ncbi:hypothetical protein DMA11_24115 [Marinilabiliaceae bacterium JC017]|nr:hypothetical protein DMA11_24115 [Marinilabiliaceae bacterium JC017]
MIKRMNKNWTISIIVTLLFVAVFIVINSISMKIIAEFEDGSIRKFYAFKNKVFFDNVIKVSQYKNIEKTKYIFVKEKDTIVFNRDSFFLQRYSDDRFQFAIPETWEMRKNDCVAAFVCYDYLTNKGKKISVNWKLTKDSLENEKSALNRLLEIKREINFEQKHVFNEVFDLRSRIYTGLYSLGDEGERLLKYKAVRIDTKNVLYEITFQTKEKYFHIFKDLIIKMDEYTYVN